MYIWAKCYIDSYLLFIFYLELFFKRINKRKFVVKCTLNSQLELEFCSIFPWTRVSFKSSINVFIYFIKKLINLLFGKR